MKRCTVWEAKHGVGQERLSDAIPAMVETPSQVEAELLETGTSRCATRGMGGSEMITRRNTFLLGGAAIVATALPSFVTPGVVPVRPMTDNRILDVLCKERGWHLVPAWTDRGEEYLAVAVLLQIGAAAQYALIDAELVRLMGDRKGMLAFVNNEIAAHWEGLLMFHGNPDNRREVA